MAVNLEQGEMRNDEKYNEKRRRIEENRNIDNRSHLPYYVGKEDGRLVMMIRHMSWIRL